MDDIAKIKTKIDSLKAEVEQSAITPPRLGSLLGEIVESLSAADAIENISEEVVKASPVRCADEAELAQKASAPEYAVGQQFYIPED